jgi:hypothetical protein
MDELEKNSWTCRWCKEEVPNTVAHNCPNQMDAIHDSELRYHAHRMKTLGWTDNWTGD